jgi:hypothetical protein
MIVGASLRARQLLCCYALDFPFLIVFGPATVCIRFALFVAKGFSFHERRRRRVPIIDVNSGRSVREDLAHLVLNRLACGFEIATFEDVDGARSAHASRCHHKVRSHIVETVAVLTTDRHLYGSAHDQAVQINRRFRCTVSTLDIERERLRLFDRVPAFAFGQQTSIRFVDPECEIGTIKALWCALKQNGPKQYNALGAV